MGRSFGSISLLLLVHRTRRRCRHELPRAFVVQLNAHQRRNADEEIGNRDYIEELAKIALHIKQAGLQSANETQKRMMDEYAKSFGTGSLNAFKESQKLWVKDIGPTVESNIGFVESYRDPAGVRSEWEGMVAMVNQERTRALLAMSPEEYLEMAINV